jgi:hypothetical protein
LAFSERHFSDVSVVISVARKENRLLEWRLHIGVLDLSMDSE